MVKAALLALLLSQWLEQTAPSVRMGALSNAAHAAPLLGNALHMRHSPLSCRRFIQDAQVGACQEGNVMSRACNRKEEWSNNASAPGMERCEAGDDARGARFGAWSPRLQRARHGAQLHAVVGDRRMRAVPSALLLLLQAHAGCAPVQSTKWT
jgi:hypothetical protein